MKAIPLTLDDLNPRESSFTLSTKPGVKIELCRWSLRVRAWALSHFGAERLHEILTKSLLVEMSEIAFFMVKDKALFASLQDFQDAIVTANDHLNMLNAMLESIGIGEPEVAKIRKAWSGEKEAPKPKPQRRQTGAKSSTP